VDVQGSYQFEVGSLGSMVASLNAVYIMDTTTTPLPGEHEYDCAGLYGSTCDAPIPDYRHSLALSWMFPANVTASLQWRYLSSVEHELNSGDETLGGTVGGVPVQLGAELDSMSYFDLSGSWSINDQYTLRLGVNNILDEDPPLVDTRWSGPGTPNTWGPYEALGRQVFLNLNAKF
jgi:iron complex outermembrane receptor protein